MRLFDTKKELFYSILFGAFLCCVAIVSTLRPFYNWDVIGYVGATLSIDERDSHSLQANTYEYIKGSVPKSNFNDLIADNNSYRKKVAFDPDYFEKQIHLYTIRPLYIGSMYILGRLNINLVQATILISVVSSLLIGFLIRIWLLRYIDGFKNIALCCLLLPLTGVTEVARLSTPDALSSAILLIALYLFIEKKKFTAAYALLILSVLARADNIVFVLVFLGFFMLFGRNEYRIDNKQSGLILASCAILFCCIMYFVGGHTAEYFFPSNYHWQVEGSEGPMFFSIVKNYFITAGVSIEQILFESYTSSFFIFFGLAILSVHLVHTHHRVNTLMRQLSLVALLGIMSRLLIFPVIANRFFVPFYVVIGISFAVDQFCEDAAIEKHEQE